jgi:hypothetical protein
MTAAQDRLSGGQLQAALANESGKLVADFTSRGKVRNVGSGAPARLSRKSTQRARTPKERVRRLAARRAGITISG